MIKPFMRFQTVNVYQLRDIVDDKNFVRLTRWLSPVYDELVYLEKEYYRIVNDQTRQCCIVYHVGKVALFVNDVTNGQFEQFDDETVS